MAHSSPISVIHHEPAGYRMPARLPVPDCTRQIRKRLTDTAIVVNRGGAASSRRLPDMARSRCPAPAPAQKSFEPLLKSSVAGPLSEKLELCQRPRHCLKSCESAV